MKTICILAFVCLTASTWLASADSRADQIANIRAYLGQCYQQEMVSEADIARIKNRDFMNPSASMKCVIACVFEKFGILQDNALQTDVTIRQLAPIVGEQKAQELSSRCLGIRAFERCEIGFNVFECIWHSVIF